MAEMKKAGNLMSAIPAIVSPAPCPMIVIPKHHTETPHERTHPWTQTEYDDGAGRYYGLKAEPHWIRTSLEDFLPYANQPAVQRFYELLEWINRPDGLLETNDCAFRGTETNGDLLFPRQFLVSGLLQFFYRHLPANCHRESIIWLLRMFHINLSLDRRDVDFVVFETAVCGTQYVEIGQSGFRLHVRFCAYGNTPAESYDLLTVAIAGLQRTLERIEDGMRVPVPTYP